MTPEFSLTEINFPNDYSVQVFDSGGLPTETLDYLTLEYATSFWASTWRELLRDEFANQYGSRDSNGSIYPETANILKINHLDTLNPRWPQILWELAGQGVLIDQEGKPLFQFWTQEGARDQILSFISPTETGGYGGEILLLFGGKKNIIGFTAYCLGTPENSAILAQKRFPYNEMVLAGSIYSQSYTLSQLLHELYPGKKLGIFLDFAISENFQGQGLGRRLFDLRLQRLQALGAQVVLGRTIRTSPAQFYGNYIARGMSPIAFDPQNQDEAIFTVETQDIKPRGTKNC